MDVCLMMHHLSRERTIFVCYQFFKQLRHKYGMKPIFTDGAHWYNTACKWLRLPHHMYGTELKKHDGAVHSICRGQDRMF